MAIDPHMVTLNNFGIFDMRILKMGILILCENRLHSPLNQPEIKILTPHFFEISASKCGSLKFLELPTNLGHPIVIRYLLLVYPQSGTRTIMINTKIQN